VLTFPGMIGKRRLGGGERRSGGGERRSEGGGVSCAGGEDVPGSVGLGTEAFGAARRLLCLISSI
jgi:hypothetical protein